MASRFPEASAATRKRLQQLLAAPPQRNGITAVEHRSQLLAWVRALARTRGGVCLTSSYPGRHVPYELECAAGHRFAMLMHGLRLGQWCPRCGHDRTKYSLDHARAAAAKHGGQCLSDHYTDSRAKLRWCCDAGHTWSASFDNVLQGHWCKVCHFQSIKPTQQDIDQVAKARGGRCLSSYVDKETPLQWQCAEGHVWRARWSHVSKGQWCPSLCGQGSDPHH